jgi:hypothetical protein
VFDDQHNLWTNVFASVCVCSSQDAKVTWTKALRKATPQKKTLSRSSEVQETKEVLPRRTVWSRAPDCLVPHNGMSGAPGIVAQRLVPGGSVERRPPNYLA